METIDNLNKFRKILSNSTKEQLIEIIANKAAADTAFELYIVEESSSLFLEKMEGLPDSVGKIKTYILAVNEINTLLDEVAGMYNDDDWIIADIAKKYLDKVLEICTSAYAAGDKDFLAETKLLFDTINVSTGCTCLDKEAEKIFGLLN